MARIRFARTCIALVTIAMSIQLSLPPALAADPVAIYAIMPLSGPAAFVGKGAADMLAVAEATVNRTGGLNGHPIKITVYDDQSKPEVAVQLTNQLIAQGVPVILGSGYVASCSAMTALAKNGPVIYCFSPGLHPQAGSFVYSAGFDTRDAIATVIRYARDKGWKKLAVLTSTDASGQDADRSFDDLLALPENASMAIIDREHFAVGDLNTAAQIAHIRAAGAQALIGWTTGASFGTVLRSAADGGLAIPIFGGIGNLTYPQMKQYATLMQQSVYFPGPQALGSEQVSNPAVRRAIDAFYNDFKIASPDARLDIGAAGAWDQTMIVLDALRKYGVQATPVQIRDFINANHYSGILGAYDFRAVPQRGLSAESVVILRWNAQKDAWASVSRPGGRAL